MAVGFVTARGFSGQLVIPVCLLCFYRLHSCRDQGSPLRSSKLQGLSWLFRFRFCQCLHGLGLPPLSVGFAARFHVQGFASGLVDFRVCLCHGLWCGVVVVFCRLPFASSCLSGFPFRVSPYCGRFRACHSILGPVSGTCDYAF